MVMRMPLDQISVLGRVTQGVRLINLKDNHSVATISLVDQEKDESSSPDEVINSESSEVVENNENLVLSDND